MVGIFFWMVYILYFSHLEQYDMNFNMWIILNLVAYWCNQCILLPILDDILVDQYILLLFSDDILIGQYILLLLSNDILVDQYVLLPSAITYWSVNTYCCLRDKHIGRAIRIAALPRWHTVRTIHTGTDGVNVLVDQDVLLRLRDDILFGVLDCLLW